MDTESTEKAAAAETENNVEKSLKTMYDGLNEAEGVLCKVSFEKGQTEKTFTIEILDNDLPQADRVVLMALMASTEGSISANGTAVLTIEDDEEYEKPIISVESDVTANPKTGTAEVVLKRETGVNYYTSVNAYTYSESAIAGEDFVPINGEQIGFLPGEIEKTIEELATEKPKINRTSSNGVIVKGIDNCLVRFSKCCNPVPGDEIIGFITRGRGVSIHRKDCQNVKDLVSQGDRIIDVIWSDKDKSSYNVDIQILANDRNGLLADIIKEISNNKCTLIAVDSKVHKDRTAETNLTIEVENLNVLNTVVKALRKVDSVYEVNRKK